ncbi:MAG: DedA family protein [Polaromonas sp.]|nr:DedA family protein [Polaromonas sp.]
MLEALHLLLIDYGILFVFVCVLLEQLGLPLPAYPVLLIAGAMAFEESQSVTPVFLSAVMASLVADTVWYIAGKRHGRWILTSICKISLSSERCVKITLALFTRWGAPALVVAKFIPGFASLATATAGIARVPLATFLVLDALGAGLWAGVGLALGWTFGPAVNRVLAVVADTGHWAIVLLVLALGYAALKIWRRRKNPVIG